MDKMRRNLMLATLATAAAGVFGMFGIGVARQKVVTKTSPAANARLGINLTGVPYWTSEFQFVDLFKQSGEWFIEGQQHTFALDADGWITQLPIGMVASTIISVFEGEHFPSGDYVILYDGEGVIKVPNHLHKSVQAGRLVVNVSAKKGHFKLEISKIDPQNYIKNIRIVPIAHEKTYQQNR